MRNAPARPRLPRALRATLTDRLDGWMVAIACVSLLLHGGLVTYLRGLDFPRRPDVEELPERVVTWAAPAAQPRSLPIDPQAGRQAAKVPVVQRPVPSHRAHGGREGAAHVALSRARLADEVGRMGLLRMLTVHGERGLAADLLQHGAPSEDADVVMDQIGGVALSTAGSSSLRPLGGGTPNQVHGIDHLRGDSPDEVDTGERGGERDAPAQVVLEPPRPPRGIPAELFAAELRRRRGGFRACYDRAIRTQPGLRGRFELRFRIAAGGFAPSVAVMNDTVGDPELARCASRVITGTPFSFSSFGQDVQAPLIFVPR